MVRPILILIATYACVVWVVGCASSNSSQGVILGQGLGAAKAGITSAMDAVDSARLHTDKAGRELLDRASVNLIAASVSLTTASTDAAKAEARCAKESQRADRAEQALADEKNHYIGYRLRISLRAIVWSVFAIVVVGIGAILFIRLVPGSAIGRRIANHLG